MTSLLTMHKGGCKHGWGWKQSKETGEWEILFIGRKQGREENKIWMTQEWGCLKQTTFSLTPFSYMKFRVPVCLFMLICCWLRWPETQHQLQVCGINCRLMAKTYSTMCQRLRTDEDFSLAHCQTGLGSHLVFLSEVLITEWQPACWRYSSYGSIYSCDDKVYFPHRLTAD